MSRQPENLRQGPTYSSADFGAPSQWGEYELQHPRRGLVPGKHFVGQTLGATGAEMSLNALPPGGEVPFLHSHKRNEELYIFLAGEGQMQVDGEVIPVRAGSIVRVAPAGKRAWRNTGATPLQAIVLQIEAGSLAQATAADGVVEPGPVRW
jgi:mannose-6-phosphate isomerase-like protein (cupin superfamily)